MRHFTFTSPGYEKILLKTVAPSEQKATENTAENYKAFRNGYFYFCCCLCLHLCHSAVFIVPAAICYCPCCCSSCCPRSGAPVAVGACLLCHVAGRLSLCSDDLLNCVAGIACVG